jgi:hypothetical protein
MTDTKNCGRIMRNSDTDTEMSVWWKTAHQEAATIVKGEIREMLLVKTRKQFKDGLGRLKDAAIERQDFSLAADLRDIEDLLGMKL